VQPLVEQAAHIHRPRLLSGGTCHEPCTRSIRRRDDHVAAVVVSAPPVEAEVTACKQQCVRQRQFSVERCDEYGCDKRRRREEEERDRCLHEGPGCERTTGGGGPRDEAAPTDRGGETRRGGLASGRLVFFLQLCNGCV
jgi:hypothetical protein